MSKPILIHQIFRITDGEVFMSIITIHSWYEAAYAPTKNKQLEVETFMSVFDAARWLIDQHSKHYPKTDN